MPFSVKDWKDYPDTSTPITQAALEDMETRLSTYTDAAVPYGWFNVMAYGAKGDGSTNDTTAINAAIDAAKAVSGTVYFPPGTYKCTSALTMPTNHYGLSFKGAGCGGSLSTSSRTASTIKYVPGASTSTPLITVAGSHGYLFEDLAFEVGSTNVAGYLVSVKDGTGDAMYVRFNRCSFGFLDTAPTVTGKDYSVRVTTAANCTALLSFYKTIFAAVTDCAFVGGKTAITLSSGGGYVNASSFERNTFNYQTTVAIDVYYLAEGVQFVNNTFQELANGTGGAIRFADDAAYRRGIKYSCNWHGDTLVTGSAVWATFRLIMGLQVDSNYFATVAATGAGIALKGCEGITITGNRFDGDGAGGATGVRYDGNCYGSVIAGNNFYGPATAISGTNYAAYSYAFTGNYGGDASAENAVSSRKASVASAQTVTLPLQGDLFTITGTTKIEAITASTTGRVVTLVFASTPTLDNGIYNLKLAGGAATDFTASADDTLTLICDGTYWIEVARSVNGPY